MSRRKKKTPAPLQLTPRAFVCWICSRDYPLLALHCAALRKVAPQDAILYIYDTTEKDARAPKCPKGAAVIGSDFERRGNLNGKACISEMLNLYATLGGLGVETVVKVDADTILTGLDWVKPGECSGFHCANSYAFTGCAYSLDMATIGGMVDYLSSHDIEPRAGYTLPEDATITMLAALAGGKVNILENSTAAACVGFSHAMRNNPQALQGVRGVVHCGQWQRVDALTALGLSRVDIVKQDMEFTLAALYGKGNARAPLYSIIPEHSYIAKKKAP